jgi:hypothetical protein
MTEIVHASEAQYLISIIAALIPLLIWAFRDAEQRLAAKRSRPQRRIDNRG